MLSEEEKSLKYFGLPLAVIHMEQFIQNCRVDKYISEEEDFSPDKAKLYFEANFSKLNKDQRKAFEYIKNLIEQGNEDGKLIFLDAPGGTGKTFTLNALVSWITMKGKEL